MFDGELFGEQMVGIVRGFFEREVSPLVARIATLEGEIASLKQGSAPGFDESTLRGLIDTAVKTVPAAKDGIGLAGALIDRNGHLVVTMSDGSTRDLGLVTGKDACHDVIRAMVDDAVTALPPPANGKDADPEVIRQMIDAAVAALPPPADGKDADPELVRQLVDEAVSTAVAALPPPADGKDADPEFVREIVDGALSAAVAALPPPVDGKDADPELVRRTVDEAVSAAIAALPPPADGKGADPELVREIVDGALSEAVAALPPPADGKDADPAVVRQIVDEAVSAAVAALPPPTDGKDADPAVVRQMVADAIAQIPPPRDGKDADLELVRQMVAEHVAELPAPKDGVGLAGALIDRDGGLIVTLSDGRTCALGPVVGKDADMAAIFNAIDAAVGELPKAKDGVDGFGFDDLTVEQTDERGFIFRFAKGERVKEFAFQLPVVLYRDVFKEGRNYAQGDSVTWGGSLWIAQRDTAAKPGEGDDWRLSVKRGRDGRDKTA